MVMVLGPRCLGLRVCLRLRFHMAVAMMIRGRSSYATSTVIDASVGSYLQLHLSSTKVIQVMLIEL